MPAFLASVGWPVLDRFRLGDIAISPHGLGIAVVAEGVETTEQADWLGRHDCRLVQGYLYGRPGHVR